MKDNEEQNNNIEHLDSNEPENKNTKTLTVPDKARPSQVFIIPVYGRPFLPSQVMPIQLSPKWESTLRSIINGAEKMAVIVALPDGKLEGEIDTNEFIKTGCLVRVIQARIGEDIQLVAQGITRAKITEVKTDDEKKVFVANLEYPEVVLPELGSDEEIECKAFAMAIAATIRELMPINPLYFEELKQYLTRFNPSDPSMLADCAAAITTSSENELQEVLDTVDLLKRLKLSLKLIKKELEVAKLQQSIKETVSEKINENQRQYFLKEQLKVIQKELGITVDDKTADVKTLKEKFEKLNPPDYVKDKFNEEINRLQVLETSSPEYAVSRDYLTWVTNIPWGIYSKENFVFSKAKKILETDHEGLKDVKDRILEFLALGSYKKDLSGAILLFVGPPGVGKTSIGKSIAKALNRPFYRFSVGGMRDEAEIKGHRRTYIGALPGKFAQALKECKVMNPVIMLDEVDKLLQGNNGDPASALLETLDPEQNNSFLDHYLDLRLDLSKCLFVCTANSVDSIPAPLLDRMDKISLSGYLAEEKLAIAKKHLLPKNLEKAGLTKSKLKIQDTALKKIIEEYARDSGVRTLEKCIAKIIRKAVVKFVEEPELESISVKSAEIKNYLGVAPFSREKTLEGVGIITGLAWTSMGGATLPVEAELIDNVARGFKLTGNLGQVMKESADIALSYVISNLGKLAPKVDKNFFEKALIHLHVPEGATPKDGPSAGVTMASALLSLAMNKAPKKGYAMTGELSLTGSVLAIGGIREKVVAAKRVGINKLIVPSANKEDVQELPDYVKDGVEFYYADTYKDVAKELFD
ncbi:MAG: endopeptidase La [Succinivibrionaceae bacterium]